MTLECTICGVSVEEKNGIYRCGCQTIVQGDEMPLHWIERKDIKVKD